MAKLSKGQKIGIIVGAVVLIAIIVAVVISMMGKGNSGDSLVERGVPVDYQEEGYLTLGEYKGIEVSVEVSDEDVESEIEDILEDAENYEQIDGVAREEDYVNIDGIAYIDGELSEDWKIEDDFVTVGAEDYFVEFDQALDGMQTGTMKELEVQIPDDFGDEDVDGKTIRFELTLNYICGDEIEQELNDSYVSYYTEGECNSVEDFPAYIKEYLYQDNIDCSADDVWSEVIDKVSMKKYHSGEVANATAENRKSYENFAQMSGYSLEELLESFGMTEDDIEEVGKDMALERMVAKTIAAKENLVLDDSTYQQLIIDYMEYEDGQGDNLTLPELEQDFEESYAESPKDSMLVEYVKQYLLSNATVIGVK